MEEESTRDPSLMDVLSRFDMTQMCMWTTSVIMLVLTVHYVMRYFGTSKKDKKNLGISKKDASLDVSKSSCMIQSDLPLHTQLNWGNSDNDTSDEEQSMLTDYEQSMLTDEAILEGIEIDMERAEPELIGKAEKWNNGISSESIQRWALSAFPRGLCIIINIKDFKYDPTPDKSWCRNESDKDVKNLTALFHELYFRVRVHENPTKKELMRIVDCYARYDGHGQTMVMIVMSHKMKFLSDDVIIPSDFNMGEGQEVRGEIFRSGVPAAWILSRFSDYNCPGLKNKPKVFIFQTARALDHNPAYFEGTVPEDWREIANPNFSEESPGCTRHYAVLKSCIEARTSTDEPQEGSRFISAFCKAVKKNAYKHNLAQLFQSTARHMKEGSEDDNRKDPEMTIAGPFQEFYFNPHMIQREDGNEEEHKLEEKTT